MGEKLSSMTPEKRAMVTMELFGPPPQWRVIADAIATAEAEAHSAGRQAERERIVDWIKAEARDCGCTERILKNLETSDG